MSKQRRTKLSITKNYDGSYLILFSRSDEDMKRKPSEVIAELVSQMNETPFKDRRGSYSVEGRE